jgi:hypothetical protein
MAAMPASQFVIRPAGESDGPGIVALRRKIEELPVPEKNDLAFWRWENIENPYGRAIAMIASLGEEVVSCFALYPRQVRITGRPYSCCLSAESMTDRRFRSKGLFPRLWYEIEPAAKALKIDLLYGFPNRNSRPVFQQGFKWLDVASPTLWVYPLRPQKIFSLRRSRILSSLALPLAAGGLFYRIPFGFKYSNRVFETTCFDQRFAPLVEEIHNRSPIVLERSLDYLNWRYIRTVGRNYTLLYSAAENNAGIAGYLVYRLASHEGQELGVIMDFQFSGNAPRQSAAELLSTALRRMDNEGACAALCLSMPGDPKARFLGRQGFIPLPRKINPHPFDLMIKFCSKDLSEQFLVNPAHWRLDFGDIDVF